VLADSALDWLYQTGMAQYIRENELAFPWIESVHVLAITLVVGSIAIVDLRLLGLASRDRPISGLTRDVLPCTWAAFAIAAVSGLLLFSSNATNYAHNPYFQSKLVLLALAGANMTWFQRWSGRHLRFSEAARALPWQTRVAGGVSLLLWIGVVAAGRWIGFTMLAGT
jgi:hypothetical protein